MMIKWLEKGYNFIPWISEKLLQGPSWIKNPDDGDLMRREWTDLFICKWWYRHSYQDRHTLWVSSVFRKIVCSNHLITVTRVGPLNEILPILCSNLIHLQIIPIFYINCSRVSSRLTQNYWIPNLVAVEKRFKWPEMWYGARTRGHGDEEWSVAMSTEPSSSSLLTDS